jgi:CRP-like cAMP-binding protein
MPHNENRLLNSLSPQTFDQLRPHLASVELKRGVVMTRPNERYERVYFPISGFISVVVELSDGSMIETGMIGRDGVLGAGAALDDRLLLTTSLVQVPGQAWAIGMEHVRRLALADEKFRSVLVRHEQVLLAQAQQSAACNASHTVEARLCRWLLRMRDIVGDDLPLTQEFLAQMIGARRPSVSLVAGTLQQAGLIKYSRGNITIIDVERVQDSACECYETVKSHYEAMLRDAEDGNGMKHQGS